MVAVSRSSSGGWSGSASLSGAVRSLLACGLALLLTAIALPAPSAQSVAACSRGTVVLTFDDGPHGVYTPQVLDVLRRKGVRATFFQVGTRVDARPALTRRVAAEGHRVGNHTWNHERLTALSDGGIRTTITRANQRIRDAGVARPTLVRPPYGATSSRVRAVIDSLDMHQVLWTVDPQDWRTGTSAATIRSRVLNNLRNGSIVLLHDGVANSGATVAALPGIIDGARSLGFCFGTLGPAGGVRPGSVPTTSPPALRVSDARVTEGRAGTTTVASVRVTLSRSSSRTVSVDYATADRAAKAGADYRAANGTISFSPGQTDRRIRVTVLGDRVDEFVERLEVRLSNPVRASIARAVGLVSIADDDPMPSLAVREARVAEGPLGTTTTVEVPVRLSAPSGKTVRVSYQTRDDSATSPDDLTATSGTLIFSPGQTLAAVVVTVVGDDAPEGNESFRVRLDSPQNATLATTSAVVTIEDDD